jgi:hypothetical protein
LLREILKINLKNMPWLKKLNIYSGHHAIGDKPLTANGIGGKECHVAGQEFGEPFCKKKSQKHLPPTVLAARSDLLLLF